MVKRLHQAALEREANERGGFLDEACAGDEALRREVQSMLAYEDDAASILESPAVVVTADSVALANLATIRVLQERYDDARALCAEGLLLCQEVEDRRGAAWCLEGLADAEAAEGHAARAARLSGPRTNYWRASARL